MSNQLLNDDTSLRMFFTDPVFITEETPLIEHIKTLEAEPPTRPIIEELPTEKLHFIGNNQQNILILVNDSVNEISNIAGAELLKNILKYLQLRKEDFALLNISKYKNLSFSALKKQFSPRILIGFGIQPDLFELEGTVDQQLWDLNGMKLILTTALPEMAEDIGAKKSFLTLLKRIDKW